MSLDCCLGGYDEVLGTASAWWISHQLYKTSSSQRDCKETAVNPKFRVILYGNWRGITKNVRGMGLGDDSVGKMLSAQPEDLSSHPQHASEWVGLCAHICSFSPEEMEDPGSLWPTSVAKLGSSRERETQLKNKWRTIKKDSWC